MKFNKFTGQFEGFDEQEQEEIKRRKKSRKIIRFLDKRQKALYQIFRDFFDVNANTKEKMLKDVFEMSGNEDIDDLITLRFALNGLIERLNLSKDKQLSNARWVVELYIGENEGHRDLTNYRTVVYVIDNLINKEFFDEVDLVTASIVCGHTLNFGLLVDFTDRILEEAIEKGSKSIQVTTHANALKRLTIIKYKELNGKSEFEFATLKEVSERFEFHLKALNKLCDENNYPVSRLVAAVREGIFNKNLDQIHQNILSLRELGEPKIATLLSQKADELLEIEIDLRGGRANA